MKQKIITYSDIIEMPRELLNCFKWQCFHLLEINVMKYIEVIDDYKNLRYIINYE